MKSPSKNGKRAATIFFAETEIRTDVPTVSQRHLDGSISLIYIMEIFLIRFQSTAITAPMDARQAMSLIPHTIWKSMFWEEMRL